MIRTPAITLLCLLLASPVFADLSKESTQKLQQAVAHCQSVNNQLTYTEYWRNSVKPENMQSVCMAEKFSDLVAAEGNPWLDREAVALINRCRSGTQGDQSYFLCLKKRLDEMTEVITEPCIELGAAQLWSEEKCVRLVSYIFMKNFETILADYKPPAQSPSGTSELSLTSKWLIEQSIANCEASGNDLVYKKYWGNLVKPENAKTVCMAEQFAIQVAAQGDDWLEKSSDALIGECKKKGKDNPTVYFQCLKENLEKVSAKLSVPCRELGEKGLWSQQRCHRLITYIFMDKFEKIFESKKSGLERFTGSIGRMSSNFWLKALVNPVTAIVFFIVFVLDVVFLIEHGTWMGITKIGMVIGPVILLAGVTQGGIRFFLSMIAIIMTMAVIAWNHRGLVRFKKEKERPREIEF